MPQPEYTFNRESYTYYRTVPNAVVPWEVVADRLYDSVDKMEEQAAALAINLRTGTINLKQYEAEMMRLIKHSHLINATIAKGGWDQMGPADWGRVGGTVQAQYGYLRTRVQKIKNGKQPMDGQFDNVSRQYIRMARRTFSKTNRDEVRMRGYDLERRVLSKYADHCKAKQRPGCVDLASRDWVPIGTLPLIGEAQCLGGCRCKFQYKNSLTRKILK